MQGANIFVRAPFFLIPQPSTLNPQTSTLNPPPSTLKPQPSTINPNQFVFDIDNAHQGFLHFLHGLE